MKLVGRLKSWCCCDAAEMSLPRSVFEGSKSGSAGLAYYAIDLNGAPQVCFARLSLDELPK